MGALAAYVRVRLRCSLRHHGRRAHRSLPRRKRRNGWLRPPTGMEDRKEGGVTKEEQVRRQIKRPDQQKSTQIGKKTKR